MCSVYETLSITKETPAEHLPLQKQPFEDIYKKGVLKNFLRLTGKNLYPESLSEEFVGFQPASLLKKRPRQKCFLINFTRFLRTPFP